VLPTEAEIQVGLFMRRRKIKGYLISALESICRIRGFQIIL